MFSFKPAVELNKGDETREQNASKIALPGNISNSNSLFSLHFTNIWIRLTKALLCLCASIAVHRSTLDKKKKRNYNNSKIKYTNGVAAPLKLYIQESLTLNGLNYFGTKPYIHIFLTLRNQSEHNENKNYYKLRGWILTLLNFWNTIIFFHPFLVETLLQTSWSKNGCGSDDDKLHFFRLFPGHHLRALQSVP